MNARVLVTDAQERANLSTVRMLGASGFEVTALATRRLAPGLWSRAAGSRHVGPDPRAGMEPFLVRLEQIVRDEPHDVLIAGTDQSLLAVSRGRERLGPYVRLGLPAPAVVELALDKSQVALRATEAGLAPPRSLVCRDPDAAVRLAGRLGYPLLAKPCQAVVEIDGRVRRHAAVRVEDEIALRRAVQSLGGSCILQQWLDGPIVSFAGVRAGGQLRGSIFSRYQRTWPPEAGSVTFSRTAKPPAELVAGVTSLLAAIGWEGIFELELIEVDDDRYAVIDLNPRPYGSMAVSSASGVPLAALWCQWLLGRETPPMTAPAGVGYRWEDGDLRRIVWDLRHRGSPRLRATSPRRRVSHAYFCWRDPVPALMRGFQLTSAAHLARRREGTG